ncbi:MAG: hypothetical protein ACHRXM_26350 [Isosphaerales bacterium]
MAEATIDHLAGDVERLWASDRQLAVDIRGLSSGLSDVKTELRLAWRIGAGLLAFLGSVVLLLGGGAFAVAWQGGALISELKSNAVQFEKRMDRLEVAVEKRIEKVEARIDRLEAKLDTRFDQLIQRLDQVVPKKGGP